MPVLFILLQQIVRIRSRFLSCILTIELHLRCLFDSYLINYINIMFGVPLSTTYRYILSVILSDEPLLWYFYLGNCAAH